MTLADEILGKHIPKITGKRGRRVLMGTHRKPAKAPKPKSTGEELFAAQCRAVGLIPAREYRFAPPRRYRFDFCFPELKLAVEVEGGVWSGGRHTRASGFIEDCNKYNLAAVMGYRVLRFPTHEVKSGAALKTLEEALK